MPLLCSIRALEKGNIRLDGELALEELDIQGFDPLVEALGALTYDVEVQQTGPTLLIRGQMKLALRCQCSRCLKAYPMTLDMPDWVCLLALEGEESVPVVHECVDLTPWMREDILLAFPRHPLCDPNCGGLAAPSNSLSQAPGAESLGQARVSAWAALDQLKLN